MSVTIENPAPCSSPKDPFGKLFSNTVTIFKSSSEAPFLQKKGKFKIGLILEVMQIRAFSKKRKPVYTSSRFRNFFYFLHPCKESNVSSFVDTVNFTFFSKGNTLVNSSCAQLPHPPAPRATAGHLPAFSVPGRGHLQILFCPGTGHLPTQRPYPSLCHARGFLSEYN